jgi:hypothetical protein
MECSAAVAKHKTLIFQRIFTHSVFTILFGTDLLQGCAWRGMVATAYAEQQLNTSGTVTTRVDLLVFFLQLAALSLRGK